MNSSNTPMVTFLTGSHPDDSLTSTVIPFENDIEKIYRGFRQCYSQNLFEDKPLTEEQQQELKQRFIERSKTFSSRKFNIVFADTIQECEKQLNILTQDTAEAYVEHAEQRYGKDALYKHLHKCEFIASHLDHLSPIEHGTLTVHVKNVDRSFSHQLVRHRIASYSQQSQRYVNEQNPTYIIPSSIQNDEEFRPIVMNILNVITDGIQRMNAINASRPKNERIKNEDIRCVFPNAMETELVVTFNLRLWMHFFNERCCVRAQWHIRSFANQVLRFLQMNIPYIFDNAGAKCVHHRICPEKQSCGRFPQIDRVLEVFHAHKNTPIPENTQS